MKIKRKKFQKIIIAMLVIAIVFAITIKMIIGKTTISAIETNTISKVENNEEKENDESVNWIESADGKLVPVPKGYSGSQIEGENTVDGGFVIYEGEIDWSTILDGSAAEALAEEAKEMDKLNAKQEKELMSEQNNGEQSREEILEEDLINEDSAIDESNIKEDITQNEEDNTSNENSTQEIEKNENQNAQETSIQTANTDENSIATQAEVENAYSITKEGKTIYYNTLEEAIAGASEGDTIKVEKDVEDASTKAITIHKSINIDTGTHIAKTTQTITIYSGVTVNIQGEGKITNSSNVDTIQNIGTLEIKTEVTIENIETIGATASAINNYGTINMSKGTIKATYKGINQNNEGTSNITGGKIIATNGTSGYGIYNSGTSSTSRAEVRIAGGVVEGGKYGIYHDGSRNYTYTYIGDSASEMNTETPEIIGGTNGIYRSGSIGLHIYNGKIKGKEEAYNIGPNNIRTGYKIAKGKETIEGEEYKIVYLEKVNEEPTKEEKAIFNLQKTVNQYVWVPVEDVSEVYGVDNKGKMLGKLYRSYGGTTRTKLNWTETNGIMKWNNATLYKEPDVAASKTDYDTDRGLSRYLSGQTRSEILAEEMEKDFVQMIKSVEKYGGFYIGRYETGKLSNINVKSAVVRKMQTAISDVRWYTMYEAAKNLKGTNKNVETSIIWGSLWDAMLNWLVESGAETTEGEKVTNELLTTSSTQMGNFANSTFNYIGNGANEPVETTFKGIGSTRIPTGSSEYTKVNNIYDIAGNVEEWTLEIYGNYRANRGGRYSNNYNYASNRNSGNSSREDLLYIGVRDVLWIN